MPTLRTVETADRDLVRMVLANRPFHRWDAFLTDVITHLARKATARFTPSHENVPNIKMIFDMDVEHVPLHLSKTCKVSRDTGNDWCTLLWFNRLE